MDFDLEAYGRAPVAWDGAVRIQPWRHAEHALWSQLVSGDDLPGILALLQLTEPEMLRGLGELSRLDGLDWMRGEGAGWVLPAFTWGGPARFNDATFGCFYAAGELETAIAETVYHQERFLRSTEEPALELHVRVLRAELDAASVVHLEDDPDPPALYDPEDYGVSQAFGAVVRASRERGIAYRSVRREGGRCVVLFHPADVVRCVSAEALAYLWDGSSIHRVERREPVEWRGPPAS